MFKDVGDLLIGAALTGADLANLLKKFVEVVLTKAAAILQHLVVDDKALHDELPESVRSQMRNE